MPPTRERGKDLCGSIVSSATFAVFSNPVMAKNDSATPARIAIAGLAPSAVSNSVSVAKSALPSAMNQTAVISTMIRPAISMKAMTMLMTTDSVIPMKLTMLRATMNSNVTRRAGGPSHRVAKYDEKPSARAPAAAKLAERKQTVMRNVSTLLPNALLT
jgi:hypothetical protein